MQHPENFQRPKEFTKKSILKACGDRKINPDDLAEFLENSIEKTDPEDAATLTDIHRQLMETYGLPWEIEPGRSMLYDVTMVNKEGSDDPASPLNPDIPNYFGTIADLESVHHGSARFLFDTYGIRAFHRYGADILAKQFEESSQQIPYGVVLTTYRDWGDGFTAMHEELRDIVSQLPTGVTIRIVEGKNGLDAVRKLVSLHRQYKDQPFRFAIVETHSHGGEHIVFSADDGDNPKTGVPGAIRKEHLRGSGSNRIESYFSKNAPIILMGCKSGMKDGIGEALEKAVSRAIYVAEDDTTAAEVTFSSWSDDFVPTVNVKYYHDKTPVKTRVFQKERGA